MRFMAVPVTDLNFGSQVFVAAYYTKCKTKRGNGDERAVLMLTPTLWRGIIFAAK